MKLKLAAAALAATTVQPALAEDAAPAAGAQSIAIMGPGLHSTNLDATIRFFTEGMGFSLISRFPMGEIEEAMLAPEPKSRGPYIMLAQRRPGGAPEPDEVIRRGDRIILRVGDAEALRRRLIGAGYKPGDMSVHKDSGTRIFWVNDPDGHHFEIVQLSAQSLMMMGGA